MQKGHRIPNSDIQLVWGNREGDIDIALKAAFSVPKKRFKKAVDRNLLKRRMKEAYRLNRLKYWEKIQSDNKQLNLMFIYQRRER